MLLLINFIFEEYALTNAFMTGSSRVHAYKTWRLVFCYFDIDARRMDEMRGSFHPGADQALCFHVKNYV